MPLIALIVLLQIACAVHCVRNGRSGLWLAVIFVFPVLGSLAYGWFEVLPAYVGRREVRRVKAAAARVLDPERELRGARQAVETSDTVANRAALGDALAALGRWQEAASQYEFADGRAPAPDRSLKLRLARAYFESGRDARARALLESLPASASTSDNDRATLLLARVLEQEGASEEALRLYADVGARLPGAEAQCRQAALLIRLDRKSAALPALLEVERRMTRMDPMERAKDADMYDWAKRSLAELRGA